MCRLFTVAIVLILLPQVALCENHSRDEVREMYSQLYAKPARTPYAVVPDASAFSAGALTWDAQMQAMNYTRFMRYLAYLPYDLTLDNIAVEKAQNAALLLAATDMLSHTPEKPAGMEESLYSSAYYTCSTSNIAAFNWFTDDMLLVSLDYFMQDEADYNLPALGHRRWILSPRLQKTGFGLANSESGVSYTVMHVMDFSAEKPDYLHIDWPSAGAFPAELMTEGTPWSVSLNPDKFDMEASSPSIKLTETVSGAQFAFTLPSFEPRANYYAINHESYGEGSCLIFRPDLSSAGLHGYEQNQIWEVEISGLVTVEGEITTISYSVEIISLEPIEPVAVEIDPQSLSLAPGETYALSALVIPSWADDLSVLYESSDPAIATVDESGLVTAIAEGCCTITAITVNGESDVCTLTVSAK